MVTMLRTVMVVFGVLTFVTGIAYPLLVTGVAQVAFPAQAGGRVALLGQPFSDPKYFWGRPSATTPQPYNGAASSGSNLGATNPQLVAAVAARVAALRTADPGNTAAVPVDLVTASASGLDPHISPAAAAWQVARVARARSLDVARVERLVAQHTTGRTFGVLGEPRVDVLALNLALDAGAR